MASGSANYGTLETATSTSRLTSIDAQPLERRASRASSVRPGPILVASSRPDNVTRLIADQYAHQVSSAALQETDFSTEPLGADMVEEPPDSFRRQTLLSFDLLRGLLLTLNATESIQLFLRSSESDLNWYSKQRRWSDSPVYILRILSNPAAAGLFCLLGIGVVLFQQSRLQLGWSRWQLLLHFAKRGLLLMIINSLLALDFKVRADGPALVENLILFTYGVLLILLGFTTVALLSFEKIVVAKFLQRDLETVEVTQESDALLPGQRHKVNVVERAEAVAHLAGNVLLLAGVAGLMVVNMLVVPRIGTVAEDKSEWFWFWVMPRPSYARRTMAYPSTLSSQYTPLSWLPFGFLGIMYARFVTRRQRSRASTAAIHLILAALLLAFFILTRVLQFGNLSTHLLPDHPNHPNNPYLESWQAFFYTVKFPPDLAHMSAALGVIALMLVALDNLPTRLRETIPLLHIGRAPIFFYAMSLLVFRFSANLALTFFGLPTRLHFGPAFFCYIATVVITWFLCRGYVAFKDARSSSESFLRFL